MNVLQSRRLWTFIVAQVVTGATLIAGHYVVDPFYQSIAAWVISFVEGTAGILIVAYTVSDSQAVKADKEVQIHRITTDADTTVRLAEIDKK